jgi:hypothetical protein
MGKERNYRQCTLEKRQGAARVTRTIWGPDPCVRVGNAVKVEENDGTWSEGWTVVAVHGDPLPERYVRYVSHAYTRQRRASDIPRGRRAAGIPE